MKKSIVRFYHRTKMKILYARCTRSIVDTITGIQRYEEAEASFKMADVPIDYGDVQMECFIGTIYLNNEKEWYDPQKALKYLERPAQEGDSRAQLQLGMIYYLGLTGTEDAVSGGYWMRKSAANGNENAVDFLRMQERGFTLNSW